MVRETFFVLRQYQIIHKYKLGVAGGGAEEPENSLEGAPNEELGGGGFSLGLLGFGLELSPLIKLPVS